MAEERRILECYYNYRAGEYEEIYYRCDPGRQSEQAEVAVAMKDVLAGRHVLEIACGSGFWTAVSAEVATSVVAIDTSDRMLAIARAKNLPRKRVRFCIGDAYSLGCIEGTFDAGLANFWLSHVPKLQLNDFLRHFHEKLLSGSVVFMADNTYISGVGGKLINRPGCEDTFKLRELSDGLKYEVLKNYYNEGQLKGIFEPFASHLKVTEGNCFWWVSYTVR